MVHFQRKETSYANKVTVMVTADLAVRQVISAICKLGDGSLVFLAFYQPGSQICSKIGIPVLYMGFKRVRGKTKFFPIGIRSDYCLHLSKNTLFAPCVRFL